jgi:hypothetical protein
MIWNSESSMTTKFIWTLWVVTIWTRFFCVRLGLSGELLGYNTERWYFVTCLEFLDELSGDRFIEKNSGTNYFVDLSAVTLEMCMIIQCSATNAPLLHLFRTEDLCSRFVQTQQTNSKCVHTIIISLTSSLIEEFISLSIPVKLMSAFSHSRSPYPSHSEGGHIS